MATVSRVGGPERGWTVGTELAQVRPALAPGLRLEPCGTFFLSFCDCPYFPPKSLSQDPI